jgi:DNA-directed RNA polymerase subunit RPC12/RpoP
VNNNNRNGGYVQCQHCGRIYRANGKFSFEDFVVRITCPICGHKYGLYCGDKQEDVYLYMNENLDWRLY